MVYLRPILSKLVYLETSNSSTFTRSSKGLSSSSIRDSSTQPGLCFVVVSSSLFSALSSLRYSPRIFTPLIWFSIAFILFSRSSMSSLDTMFPPRLLSIDFKGVSLGVEIFEIGLLITLDLIGVRTPLNCKPCA